MNLKLILFSSLTLIIWTLSSFTEKKIERVNSIAITDTIKSPLLLFGEYIYKREKCARCHSLSITDNKNKVSLDGLNGKYPLSWHNNHLIDPSSMVLDSEMPSFEFLSNKLFEKDTIEKYLYKLSNEDWSHIISESNTILKELNGFGISLKSNTELIALVSYLKNIPPSKEYKLIRNIEMEKESKEMAIKDSIWANSDNVIKNTITNPKSIQMGKLIFNTNCSPCHGSRGEGMIGPNLTDDYWLNGSKDSNIVKTIIYGVPNKGMLAWKLNFTPTEIGQLVSYIKTLRGAKPKNSKISQGIKE